MSYLRYRFRCPHCDAAQSAWEYGLRNAKRSGPERRVTSFPCVECGRLIEPNVRFPWQGVVVVAGLIGGWVFTFAYLHGLWLFYFPLTFTLAWAFGNAWLMPYVTGLRPAKREAT
jgi:hypothetical protein